VTRTCHCGAWLPRDDEHVARRRAAVGNLLLGRVVAPVVPSTPIDLGDALDALSPWIATLFEALDALGGRDADPSPVTSSVEALLELRSRAMAVPRLRPWLALWDPLRTVLDALAALARVELEAAIAPDPTTAQASEVVAQGYLDDAARGVRILNERLDSWGIETSIRLPHSLVAAASAVYDATGAENVVDLDGRGLPLYTRITGRAAAPAGVGVGLLLDLGHVDRALDEDRVYRVAATVYQRLDRHRQHLVALLDDPGWRADLLNARRVFYEAQLSTETLLRELAGERRLEVEAVLRLGSRLAERVSACLVGLVVAVDPVLSVGRTADYTTVHRAARQAALADLLMGFDERIRNADAHADFDVEDEHVVLGRNRTRAVRLPNDQLVDIVLAGVESSAAILAGLDCVLAELDHPSGRDRLLDLPLEPRLQILLAVSGVLTEQIELGRDRIEIHGTAMGSVSARPLSVIATISPYVPREFRRLRLHLKGRDATLVTDVSLGLLRRFLSGEGLAKETAFVEFLARASINGRVVFPRRHSRFMLATFAHRHLERPLAAAGGDLRTLVAVAQRLGDEELTESLTAFIAAKRAREGGPPAPRAARRAVERLATYLGTPPGPWNDGSPPSSSGLVPA